MSNRRTEIQHESRDGDRFQVTAQETDSPILPVAQLKTLHDFRPDLVDWVVTRTEAEATERRKRQRRVDRYIFVERIGGLAGGIAIAALGIGTAAYLALHNAQTVAVVIGGGTLATIVSVIVTGKRKRSADTDSSAQAQQQKKKR